MNLQLRVYYADTDCGGVVYYANYLRYMEAGRMEFMREQGVDLTEWHRKGYVFVVAETTVKYRASARLDDVLDIVTTLQEKSSITLSIKTVIYNQKQTLLITALTRLACLGEDGKVSRIPDEIINKLEQAK